MLPGKSFAAIKQPYVLMESRRRPSMFSRREGIILERVILGLVMLGLFTLGWTGSRMFDAGIGARQSHLKSNQSYKKNYNTARLLGIEFMLPEPLPRKFPAPHLKSLVLVACHSVYTGLDFSHPEDSSSWYLLDYQKVPGQTHSFIQHIELGVAQAATSPNSMLLFSGGKTRRNAGPRAESMGYWLLAEANEWFGHPQVRDQAFTEEHARDSYENLLFGLCRFYELTGHYPESIIVIGYDFKRSRFFDIHRAAVRWPADRFDYVGTPALTEAAENGEQATVDAFKRDPYGCFGDLAAKRIARDPFADGGYAGERCPDLAELLSHCGPNVYSGDLPWGIHQPLDQTNLR